MIRRLSSLPVFAVVLCLGAANAADINDAAFGFRLNIPDEFMELESDPAEPNTIYKFVDREPTANDPAHVIQIQRLRGLIATDSRMTESDIPAMDGIDTTLRELRWNGLPLDVLRQTMTLPTGVEYVVYGIQYPLAGEAVQLQVGGPVDEDQEVYARFSKLAGGFENTRPLYTVGETSGQTLTTGARIYELAVGIFKLAITALVLLFLFRLIKQAFVKPKTKPKAKK